MKRILAALAALLLALPAAAQTLSAQASSGQVLIQSITTSGNAASVTFSGIPQNYSHLRIRIYGASNAAVANDAIFAQFNADTGANYDWYQGIINNGSASAVVTVSGGSFATTSMVAGYLNGQNATVKAGSALVDVVGYSGTTFNKTLQWSAYGVTSAANAGGYSLTGSSDWRNSAAVTSIKLFLNTGPFTNGTVVSLYGVP